MTAPGGNLEFFESEAFGRRVAPAAGVRSAAMEHLKSWPRSGAEVAGGVREFGLRHSGVRYAVLYRRQSNRVSLMYVFRIPEEEAALEEQRKDIRRRYGRS